MTDETPCCTCLSLSRDPLCVYHGDIDKVAACSYTVADFEAQALESFISHTYTVNVMPTAPMHPCAEPRCAVLLPTGQARCPAHTRPQEEHRGSNRERGYTHRWERAANRFKAEYPLCGMRPHGQAPVMSRCHDEGRVTVAYQVDHVVPHKGDQTKFWDQGNWQSLCASCGSAKTRAGL